MKTPKELRSLKEKMLALQLGDFDVEADNPRIVRCWERMQCDKTDCPAYGKLRCWSIAGTCCHGEVKGKFAKKIMDCRECVVFKESCADDMGELIETFNMMVNEMRYNISARMRADQEKAEKDRLSDISQMVAGVAHETRNPLHSIGMAASFLKKKYRDDLMDEFLGIIEDEVKKLTKLTATFLQFSNPAPIEREPCDLNEIVEVSLERYMDRIDAHRVRIGLDLDPALQEFESDPARLAELFSCLLENALDAVEAGSDITVATEKRGRVICLSIEDEGGGISAENQKSIFKPFFTTKVKGPGLGLAIVRRIVEELGGTLTLESDVGKGARFTVCFPYIATGLGEETEEDR